MEEEIPTGSTCTAIESMQPLGVVVTDKTLLAHYTITRVGCVKKGFSEYLPLDGYQNLLVVKYRGRGNPMRWLALRVLLLTLRLRHKLPSARIFYEV